MSLGTDAFGLAAAAMVAASSVFQLRQAFADLNERTPLKGSFSLFWTTLRSLRQVVIPRTDEATLGDRLRALDLGQVKDVALTGDQARNLKKWLVWFLGWFFISLGAIAALGGAICMLVNDL
jgi:hypothetical protein